MVTLSPQQLEIVEARLPRVFVSAGAGSGKTSVLVARYVRALLVDELSADEVLAVTFTDKAAAELKSRIRGELLVERRPALARDLESAPVGTIHGLCSRLLRQHAVQAGVDPRFTVLDESQAEMLQAQVFDEIWADLVSTADPTDLSVLGANERMLRKESLPLYERLRQSGSESPRFQVEAGIATSPAEAQEKLTRALRTVCAATLDSEGKTALKNRAKAEACLGWLGSCPSPQQISVADLWEVIGESVEYQPDLSDRRGEVREARQRLLECREALARPYLLAVADLVDRMLQGFDARYTQRKSDLGALDFTDLELKALALVRSGKRLLPGRIALLVDEFQDTNALQCAILDGLRPATLFTVGDLRQSIYSFRHADVEVFRQRQALLERTPKEALVGPLDVNYRSRKSVLDVINRMFSAPGLFGPEFMALKAHRLDDQEASSAGRVRGSLSPSVELLLFTPSARPADNEEEVAAPGLDREDTSAAALLEMEARGVARRVRRLIDEEAWSPGDIVVLVRKHETAEVFARALEAQGVPRYVVGGIGYYQQQEVTDLVALLTLLANPLDDLAFTVVARSPLVGISDDALWLLNRHRRKGGFLWEAARDDGVPGLTAEDDASLRRLIGATDKLRTRLGRPGLAGLVWDAMCMLGYDEALLGGTHGARRFANARKLMRRAAEFELLNGPDLPGLVEFLRSNEDLGTKEGSAPTLGEDEDVVRLMTVHAAKGLQFPVVIVGGSGSPPRKPERPSLAAAPDGRVGLALAAPATPGSDWSKSSDPPDVKVRFDRETLGPVSGIWADLERRAREEEIRLYYVAMTRAEERLILTASRPDKRSVMSLVLGSLEVEMPRSTVGPVPLEGLDAVLAAVDVDITEVLTSRGTREESVALPAPPAFPAVEKARSLPRHVSFSSLAQYERCPRRFYLERALGLDLTPPDAPWDADEDGGREIGSLVHALLERVSLAQAPSKNDLDAALSELVGEMGTHLDDQGLRRAAELAMALWDSPVASLPGIEHAVKEAGFMFEQGGTLVTGQMDLLVRDQRGWTIVDYKTNHLRGELPAEAAAAYELQGQVYALAALLAGAPRVDMLFLFLERPGDPVTVTYVPQGVEQLRERLDMLFRDFSETAYEARRGDGCGGCAVYSVCLRMADQTVV